MHELDRPVVDDEKSPLDERSEHALYVLVLVGLELAASDAAARERLTVSTGDKPEEHPARDLLFALAK
jgi:hypothetical protein